MRFRTYDAVHAYVATLKTPGTATVIQHWYCAQCWAVRMDEQDCKTAKEFRSQMRCESCGAMCTTGYGLWERRSWGEDVPVANARVSIMKGVEARAVPEATRPCTLTQGCFGKMKAIVKNMGDVGFFLWWHCGTCGINYSARSSKAVRDPRVEQAVAENKADDAALAQWASETSAYGEPPVDPDMQELTDRILSGGE